MFNVLQLDRKIKYLFIVALIILFIVFVALYYFFIFKKIEVVQQTVLYGKVIKISDGEIQVVVDFPGYGNSGDPENKKNFFIEINKDTTFFKYSGKIKNEAQFYQEQADFNDRVQKLKETGNPPVNLEAPSWKIFNESSFQDLTLGDKIKLYLIDRGSEDNFLAKKIIILGKAVADTIDYLSEEAVYTISGQIKRIEENQLYVLVNKGLITDQDEKKVLLDKDTGVYEMKLKTEEQFYKEQSEFNKKTEELRGGNLELKEIIAPSRYQEIKTDLSRLSIGDIITVVYKKIDDENSIIADRISFSIP